MEKPLPAPRRLVTPTRESLLRSFQVHESRSRLWITLELIIIFGGTAWWISQSHTIPGWQFLILFAVGFFGLFDFICHACKSRRRGLRRAGFCPLNDAS